MTGKTGNHVQRHVGLARSNVHARAPGRGQLLAGKIALVPVANPDHAKEYLAQVNTQLMCLSVCLS